MCSSPATLSTADTANMEIVKSVQVEPPPLKPTLAGSFKLAPREILHDLVASRVCLLVANNREGADSVISGAVR